jgi:hypothetical protein
LHVHVVGQAAERVLAGRAAGRLDASFSEAGPAPDSIPSRMRWADRSSARPSQDAAGE